jgi:hypothetical protein
MEQEVYGSYGLNYITIPALANWEEQTLRSVPDYLVMLQNRRT